MHSISLIGGPGAHGEILLKLLRETGYTVQHFRYSPKFEEKIYTNNEITRKIHSTRFQLKDKILAQYFNKLLKSKTAYNEKLWNAYDKEVAKRLMRNDVLIAWPQVSLNSIKKQKQNNGRVLLEYPMIHVNEWQLKMKQTYEALGIKKSVNMFSERLVNRMVAEINLSDNINVLSSYAKNTFVHNGVDESKISIVAPYVDDAEFFIDKDMHKEKEFTFLFVGRIDVLKGAHLLLEAFHKAGLKSAKLLMAGHVNHEIKPYIEKYHQNVSFIPYQNREQLKELYNRSHALLLPSVQESYGMVLLEAMLCGIPVIASSNTAATDLISDINGSVFQSGSVDNLIESLTMVYTNYGKFEALKIRESVLQKSNAKLYKTEYLKLLKSVSLA